MGTPAFAVRSLEALVERHDVGLVVTRPDRPAGRGSGPRPCPVAAFARERGLELLQPARLTPDVVDRIAAVRPDVVCVAAFGMILPPELLRVPRHGCINVHASLLPRHRGAAPVQRAILADDAMTGVSIMLMEEGLDTGPYALQRPVPIADRYAVELEEELAVVGARALVEVLGHVEDGTVVWTPQDDSQATYAPKVTKDDVALRPELTAHEAMLRVRASTRSAPARACVGEKELTVVRAHVRTGEFVPGSVCLIDGEPVLGFADGGLALEIVRPAGRAEMTGVAWARGARLAADACWRCTR